VFSLFLFLFLFLSLTLAHIHPSHCETGRDLARYYSQKFSPFLRYFSNFGIRFWCRFVKRVFFFCKFSLSLIWVIIPLCLSHSSTLVYSNFFSFCCCCFCISHSSVCKFSVFLGVSIVGVVHSRYLDHTLLNFLPSLAIVLYFEFGFACMV